MLQKIRLEKGLSREHLARLCKISSRTIYLIERKGRIPHNATAEVLSRVLGVSVAQLFPEVDRLSKIGDE